MQRDARKVVCSRFSSFSCLGSWYECSGCVAVRVTSLPSLIAAHVIAFRWPDVDLAWPGNLLFRVGEHLFPLRDPACRSRDCKEHREDGDREPHGLVDQAGIEVDVRVELAGDEIIIRQRDTFEFECDVEQRIAAGHLENEVSDALDDRGPWIVRLVDA